MLRPCSHAAALAILSLLATLDMLFQPASRSGAIAAKDAELKFDAYGGIAALPCPGGKKPRFYTEKFDKWWHLCTPAGNAFWMNAVYNLSEAGDNGADHEGVRLHDLLVSKYRNGFTSNVTLNIALQQMRRLQSWGFNTVAEFDLAWDLPVSVHPAWPTPDHTIPIKMPFTPLVYPAFYSLTNNNQFARGPVKDIVSGIRPDVLTSYRAPSPDFWDPNFAEWLQNALAKNVHSQFAGLHGDYLMGLVVDETDRLFGFGAGVDFPTLGNGKFERGHEQPHLGWMILVTAATQTENTRVGAKYSDPTVFSKEELSRWLGERYHGNIAALNQAWGSAYSTFGSDGGWGKGKGLLDEDGRCPAQGQGKACWVPSDGFGLTGATASMKADLGDFLLHDAEKYFATVKSAIEAEAPGVLYFGPTVLGTYGAPPRRQILEAASKYVDVYIFSNAFLDCPVCQDVQQRIDFLAQYGGDKPWVGKETFRSQADSYMSVYPSPGDQYKNQAERGSGYMRLMQAMLNARDTATGTRHFTGLKWWEFYDRRAEQSNWGLVTLRDDPYDGVSATRKPGKDEWGYPTGCLPEWGCEKADYGDFLSAVQKANQEAFKTLADEQPKR